MAEYSREQRNQLSRAIANNETGSKQLKGVVDNRNLVMQTKTINVMQLQQTDICLKKAEGDYNIKNKTSGVIEKPSFIFKESSKGSDVIHTTKSHPQRYIDYSELATKYLKKQEIIPLEASDIVYTTCETYGIKK